MQQLSTDSASNVNNNNISKHQHQQQQQMMMNSNYSNEIKPNLSQNDFWFNEKINEAPVKTTSTPPPSRPTKSLFSPSPEHPDEKSKYMMMTSNIKRESGAVNSPKEERKSTPSKREKLAAMSGLSAPLPHVSQSQKPQMPMADKKFKNEINPPSTVDMAALTQDPIMPNKKRPYTTVKDEALGSARGEKVRKVEGIKTESRMPQLFGSALDTPPIPVPSKQPIETNPDIVKSLLKECFSSSNKFDQYDNDSPLDVINPEPPEELLAVPSKDTHTKKEMDISVASNATANAHAESDDKMDSSAGEGHGGKHKHKKSKKKKEKHKHKKKHKHSDRESSPPMRMILSKNSSPESQSAYGGGGLKIKIPIKDVATAINPQQTPQPAPIKLKISKEKFGSFTNLNNNNTSTPSSTPSMSSSSSSHKKKDKDREKSKSKSSKHGSDFKESSSYHHQQHST